MIKSISRKDILRQLKADLIGKDSHRGVTLTYAWLANQFGHISLGFIPTFVLYIFLSKKISPGDAALWSATIISVTWLLFETYNFLGPLLLKQQSHSRVLFLPKSRYVFEPEWKNIAFDTITDILFFWFGAFICSLLCFHTATASIVLLAITSLLVYPCSYWYPTKMYLQIPQYPYQFRLSQWDFEINEKDKKAVQHFLNNKRNGLHLFVFGSKGSGKTSLAVAIATELSIKHHACTYTTAIKLYSMFFEPAASIANNQPPWDWRCCSVLVIDDINPGGPVKDEIVSPELFLKFLDNGEVNEVNRLVMRNSNVVWVLGERSENTEVANKWLDVLKAIGVSEEKVLTINLSANEH